MNLNVSGAKGATSIVLISQHLQQCSLGDVDPFCIELKFSNARKVLLQNTYKGFSPCTAAVSMNLVIALSLPRRPRVPIGRNILWGLVLLTYSSCVQYLATMCLRGLINSDAGVS